MSNRGTVKTDTFFAFFFYFFLSLNESLHIILFNITNKSMLSRHKICDGLEADLNLLPQMCKANGLAIHYEALFQLGSKNTHLSKQREGSP